MKRRNFVGNALSGIAAFSSLEVFAAPGFPQKAINMIVPYSTGGATDNVARPLADLMGKSLGQPIIIDNRAGANGRIGTDWVAKSKPDGYSLLVGGIGPVTIAPHFEKVPYDALRDLAPLSLLVLAEEILVVNNDLPVKTFPELVAFLKREGPRVNFGSAGKASPNHMAGELLKAVAGVEMTHIPYKGDGAALVDLSAGTIQLMFATVSAALPHIQSGRVRVIAGGGENRPSAFKDIKTIAEQGFPGFSADVWIGLFGPAGLPKETVGTIQQAIAKAMKDERLRDGYAKQGMSAVGSSPDAFSKFVKVEYEKWGKVIRERQLATAS